MSAASALCTRQLRRYRSCNPTRQFGISMTSITPRAKRNLGDLAIAFFKFGRPVVGSSTPDSPGLRRYQPLTVQRPCSERKTFGDGVTCCRELTQPRPSPPPDISPTFKSPLHSPSLRRTPSRNQTRDRSDSQPRAPGAATRIIRQASTFVFRLHHKPQRTAPELLRSFAVPYIAYLTSLELPTPTALRLRLLEAVPPRPTCRRS